MNTQQIAASLETALDHHHALAMAELERLVTDILIGKNRARSFISAMGCVGFYDKDGEPLDLDHYAYMKPVDDLVMALDNVLKISGTPLRLEVDRVSGNVVKTHDW